MQPLKPSGAISVTPDGMVMDSIFELPVKESLPIDVRLSASKIEVNPVQPLKALAPIILTLLGIVIKVRPVQPQKAYCPMTVTV